MARLPRPVTPTSRSKYKLFYVCDGGKVKEAWKDGAPDDNWMLKGAAMLKASFAIRYMPSKKGWTVLDTRRAQNFTAPGQNYSRWVGHVRLPRAYPNEDAAIMLAIHLLSAEPKLL